MGMHITALLLEYGDEAFGIIHTDGGGGGGDFGCTCRNVGPLSYLYLQAQLKCSSPLSFITMLLL